MYVCYVRAIINIICYSYYIQYIIVSCMWFRIISWFYYCCGVILRIIIGCTKLRNLLVVFLEWHFCNFMSWLSPSEKECWYTFYYDIIILDISCTSTLYPNNEFEKIRERNTRERKKRICYCLPLTACFTSFIVGYNGTLLTAITVS